MKKSSNTDLGAVDNFVESINSKIAQKELEITQREYEAMDALSKSAEHNLEAAEIAIDANANMGYGAEIAATYARMKKDLISLEKSRIELYLKVLEVRQAPNRPDSFVLVQGQHCQAESPTFDAYHGKKEIYASCKELEEKESNVEFMTNSMHCYKMALANTLEQRPDYPIATSPINRYALLAHSPEMAQRAIDLLKKVLECKASFLDLLE